MSEAETFFSISAEETRAIGERIGRKLETGDVLLLHGDLGAGKTTLTQGIALGLGIREPVQSPTFTLVAEHPARDGLTLYHLDLYRLTDPSEVESFGYEQYLEAADGVTVVEWPERAPDWLPERYLLIELSISGQDRRTITVRRAGEWALTI